MEELSNNPKQEFLWIWNGCLSWYRKYNLPLENSTVSFASSITINAGSDCWWWAWINNQFRFLVTVCVDDEIRFPDVAVHSERSSGTWAAWNPNGLKHSNTIVSSGLLLINPATGILKPSPSAITSFFLILVIASEKYTRNYIRNQLIPAAEKMFPAVKQNQVDNRWGIFFFQLDSSHQCIPFIIWVNDPLHTSLREFRIVISERYFCCGIRWLRQTN